MRHTEAAASPDKPQKETEPFNFECGEEQGTQLNGKKLTNGWPAHKSASGGLEFDCEGKVYYLSFHNNPGLKEKWEAFGGEPVEPDAKPAKEPAATE